MIITCCCVEIMMLNFREGEQERERRKGWIKYFCVWVVRELSEWGAAKKKLDLCV